jgi:hypothetical protein
LALDFSHERAVDKAHWAARLVSTAQSRVPRDIEIESYDIGDRQIYIRMRSDMKRGQLQRMLKRDDAIMRLCAYLADMGARPEFEFDDEKRS